MNAYLNARESKKKLTVYSVWLGLFAALLVSGTQSSMLPVAAEEIGGDDIYALVNVVAGVISVVLMPLWGFWAAKNPAIKPRLYGICLIIGGASFIVRSMATSMWTIILVSPLYAIVSASVFAVGYSLIRDIYEKETAAKYLGVAVTFNSASLLLGPFIGGLLIDNFGWRACNHLIWPFMIAAGILALLGVTVKKEDVKELAQDRKFDFLGAVGIVLFLGGFLLFLALGSSYAQYGSLFSWILLAAGILGIIILTIAFKKKGADCIVPIGVIKDRNTRGLALGNFFMSFSNIAISFFLASYLIRVNGVSATAAGLCTTLSGVVGIFMGPVFGRMIGKQGTVRGMLTVSAALRAIITTVLILCLQANVSIIIVYALCVLLGFSQSTQASSFTAGPQVMLNEENRVQGNSIIQLCQNFGGGTGSAVYGLLIGIYGLEAGLSKAFMLAACLAAIAMVFALTLKKKEA